MQCELSGVPTSVLLDNGAQVSIVSEKYLLEDFINAESKTISKIFDGHDSLKAQWENNSEILFAGFAILQSQVGDSKVLEVKLMFHS